jgi:glycosyltransferase involved in cell wall biosynthesis
MNTGDLKTGLLDPKQREEVITSYVASEQISPTPGVELCQAGTTTTLVVPAFNEEEGISHTLNAIVAMDHFEQVEVVFVDNNSTDRTAEIIRSYAEKHANIILLQESKQGIAFARKRGMDEVIAQFAAKGDFEVPRLIGMTDADSEISKAWATTVLRYFRESDYSVMSGFYHYPSWFNDGAPLEPGSGLFHPKRGLRRKLFESGIMFRNTDGRNSVIEAAAYCAVGGVQQAFAADGTPLRTGEDFGLGVRWAKMGGEIGFLPEGAVTVTNPRRFLNFRLEKLKSDQNTILPKEYYTKDIRIDAKELARTLNELETAEDRRNSDIAQIISAMTHNVVKPILLGYHSDEKVREFFGNSSPFIADLDNTRKQELPADDYQLTQLSSELVKKHLNEIELSLWGLLEEQIAI